MVSMVEVQLGKILPKTSEKFLSSVSGISVKTEPGKVLIGPTDPSGPTGLSFLYSSVTVITNVIIALVNGINIIPPE